MSERMDREDARGLFDACKSNTWSRQQRLAALADWRRARDAEIDKDAKIQRLEAALSEIIQAASRSDAGVAHEIRALAQAALEDK